MRRVRFWRWMRHLTVVRVQPGDVFVFRCPERVTFDVAQRIQHTVKEAFPGHSVVIVDGGSELGVAREAR